MAFFNKGRRELISKTLMNLVQISAAAALAGNLFVKLNISVKILFAAIVITLFISGILICPDRRNE